MGAWGVGLYANDMAMDLKGSIKATLRLPFDEERLLELLCESESSAAYDPNDEDHCVFWLVIADQFVKRGVATPTVREKALSIIDSGSDLAMLEKRGLKASELRKRARFLEELRARIVAAPTTSKPRSVLKEPQPYTLHVGGLYAYPTCGGEPINPYMGPKLFNRAAWRPDGFGLMLIVHCHREFEYLAVYQPLIALAAVIQKPSLDQLADERLWILEAPGTCSLSHYKKMELEEIGVLGLEPAKLRKRLPIRDSSRIVGRLPHYAMSARAYAIDDISIANRMGVAPRSKLYARLLDGRMQIDDVPTVMKGLGDILAGP
jgi:hypothetical protein